MSKNVERTDVKNNGEGADVVGELSGENACVMAKGMMGRVEIKKRCANAKNGGKRK
jgi:hypothetical protein